jgi:hypothetical protein
VPTQAPRAETPEVAGQSVGLRRSEWATDLSRRKIVSPSSPRDQKVNSVGNVVALCTVAASSSRAADRRPPGRAVLRTGRLHPVSPGPRAPSITVAQAATNVCQWPLCAHRGHDQRDDGVVQDPQWQVPRAPSDPAGRRPRSAAARFTRHRGSTPATGTPSRVREWRPCEPAVSLHLALMLAPSAFSSQGV